MSARTSYSAVAPWYRPIAPRACTSTQHSGPPRRETVICKGMRGFRWLNRRQKVLAALALLLACGARLILTLFQPQVVVPELVFASDMCPRLSAKSAVTRALR